MKKLNSSIETLIESIQSISEDDDTTAGRILDTFHASASLLISKKEDKELIKRSYKSTIASQRIGRFRQGVNSYECKRRQLLAVMSAYERLGSFLKVEQTGLPLSTMIRQYGKVLYDPANALDQQLQDYIVAKYLAGHTATQLRLKHHIVTVYDVIYSHRRDEILTELAKDL